MMSLKNNSYTGKYDIHQEAALKKKLQDNGFSFKELDYAFWRAIGANVSVSFYKSGKILVQGEGTENFTVQYLNETPQTSKRVIGKVQQSICRHCGLDPQSHDCEMLKQVQHDSLILDRPDLLPAGMRQESTKGLCPCHPNDDRCPIGMKQKSSEGPCPPWIGSDESGKGDYFGPLVIAAVLVDETNKKILEDLNVRDSKTIKDASIQKMAVEIRKNSVFSIVVINPQKYNQLYEKFKNLNKLLAWGHARAIENILEKKPCKNAISDKFGDESLIKNALMKHGKSINLIQRTKAESDIAVAAASILARDEFVRRIKNLELEYKMKFPKGASEKTIESARNFVKNYGKTNLENVAKLHFKTTNQITNCHCEALE